MEKLEWLRYHTVKNFEDIFIRFGATHKRDGQTDRHRVTEIAALCIASHDNKTILKQRVAAPSGRDNTYTLDFPDVKFRVA